MNWFLVNRVASRLARGGRIALLSAACVSFSLPVMAAGLMDVYRQAVQNDPVLESYQLQTQVALEGRRQTLAELLPTVMGTANYSQKSQNIVSSDNEVFGSGRTQYSTTAYALTLTQPLFRWGSYVGWKQSDLVQAQAEMEYVLAGQDLIIRVADLYFTALAAKDQLEYASIEEAAVAKHYELAQGRSDMGLIPITDLHDAKARLSATHALTVEAKNKLDDALQALSEVTGGPVDNLAALQKDIALRGPEPAGLNSWIDGALNQNPAIELRKKVVEVAEMEVRRKKADHYPTVDLLGSYDNEETDGSLFGGGSEVNSMSVGVQLTVPLYQGGAVSSRVRSARHEVSIAQQELIRQNRSVQRKTRSAFLGVDGALKKIDALTQSMEASRLALEAKQEGYMSGLFTSLGVLDAERDLALVSIDHAQARYDYILNSLRLKQAVGSLAEKDLLDLENWLTK